MSRHPIVPTVVVLTFCAVSVFDQLTWIDYSPPSQDVPRGVLVILAVLSQSAQIGVWLVATLLLHGGLRLWSLKPCVDWRDSLWGTGIAHAPLVVWAAVWGVLLTWAGPTRVDLSLVAGSKWVAAALGLVWLTFWLHQARVVRGWTAALGAMAPVAGLTATLACLSWLLEGARP